MTISNTTDLPSPLMPSQQHNGKFRNTRPNQHKPSFGKTLQLMWKFYLTNQRHRSKQRNSYFKFVERAVIKCTRSLSISLGPLNYLTKTAK